MLQSPRVAATRDGSEVLITVRGCVRGVTVTSCTLVSVPSPVLATVKVTVPVSQLSRNASPSPPAISRDEVPWIARFGPATGVTVTHALIGPRQARLSPTGMTLK